jgi:hypothetical protein
MRAHSGDGVDALLVSKHEKVRFVHARFATDSKLFRVSDFEPPNRPRQHGGTRQPKRTRQGHPDGAEKTSERRQAQKAAPWHLHRFQA